MIFPILAGWLGPRRAPMTWLLVFLNLAMFSVTSRFGHVVDAHLQSLTSDEFFVRAQGRIYARYLEDHASPGSGLVDGMAERVSSGDLERIEALGHLAFRDEAFLQSYESVRYEGDQVAFSIWKARLAELLRDRTGSPDFLLGVSAIDGSLARWVSYIFVHSGTYHLLGNMLFLLLFGAALEIEFGALLLLMVFLGSGVAAAGIFAMATGLTGSPLVGASGAISGVMAFYCAIGLGRPLRYFWFLLPWPGYLGFVWLPAWLALGLWTAADVAGYVATLPEFGGVAHTAHLGGNLAGVMVGYALSRLRPSLARPREWPVPIPIRDVHLGKSH